MRKEKVRRGTGEEGRGKGRGGKEGEGTVSGEGTCEGKVGEERGKEGRGEKGMEGRRHHHSHCGS